jgi:hypothetical protein
VSILAVRCSRTENIYAILFNIGFYLGRAAMLKPQDCIILIKLLANPDAKWSQRQLAKLLCISLAETNAGIKRLGEAGLLRKDKEDRLFPNINAAEELLISGIKFFFPVKLGEYTRGIPTAIAAHIFHGKIALGNDPIPVWPDAKGEKRGVALAPIHPAIPKALRENPDQAFFELLALVDAIRSGRPRERNLAASLLKEKLKHAKQ